MDVFIYHDIRKL